MKGAPGLIALGALCAGCLEAAPSFAPRGQIPPFVVSGQVEPPAGVIYDGPIPFDLNVPFRSEDVNVDLEARLFLDLVPGSATGSVAQADPIAASTYDDTSRSVSMTWSQSLSRGCHSLTLILTYFDNFDVRSDLPLDDERAARVVWLLAVDDADESVSIASCPSPGQPDPQP